jgi:hypothetical protein
MTGRTVPASWLAWRIRTMRDTKPAMARSAPPPLQGRREVAARQDLRGVHAAPDELEDSLAPCHLQ